MGIENKKNSKSLFTKFYFLVLGGIFFGLISLSFYLSNAASYLSDKSETCINCHVMKTHYVSWSKSAHREYASCIDCHVPHDNIIKKYLFKASDGLRHAYVFTFRLEPQNIMIKEAGKKAVQENCIRCHFNQVQKMTIVKELNEQKQEIYCWNCHRETPHGRATSLSSAANAYTPIFILPTPDWIADYIKIKNK
jgi:cytochrome c nitrite reductase small subunit